MFQDESLEMGIIRDLKTMGFTSLTQLNDSIGWLQPFMRSFENLSNFVGGLVGAS